MVSLAEMAPMASGITTGKQERFIFLLGFLKGFIAPRIPVDGVVGMPEEVGRRFMN
jgi:hypothetical protein